MAVDEALARYLDFGSWMSLLVWAPVAAAARQHDAGLGALFDRPTARRHADGTVQLDTTADIAEFWALLRPHRPDGLRVRENTRFRSLRCFPSPPREYQLVITADYFDRLGGEDDFLVVPTGLTPVGADEADPADLGVRVRFVRPPTMSDRAAVGAALRGTPSSAAHVRPDTVRFAGRWLTFRATAATQGDVNALTLALLNAAAATVPASEIRYGEAGPD
jgi:hypothetical protein